MIWFQYLAYLSWLKLGEVAVNPFGEDDDDFDIVGLFENHVGVQFQLMEIFNIFLYTFHIQH